MPGNASFREYKFIVRILGGQVLGGFSDVKRNVSITLQNEPGQPVITWNLQKVAPAEYTGPNLAGKGGDVAIEELVLSSEQLILPLEIAKKAVSI